MNDFIELHRLFTTILKRWWLVVVLTAVAASIGYFVARQQTPVYQATTTLLVGQSMATSQLERVDIQTSQALMETYVDIATRQPVLEGVVNTLLLNESWQSLSKRITASPITNTQLIEIKVEASSPAEATAIANEIARQMLLLATPAAVTSPQPSENDAFNNQQVLDLQQRIVNAQARLDAIEVAMSRTVEPIEMEALQREKTSLESLLVSWQRNYTDLLPFTLIKNEKDPGVLTVIETAHATERPIRPRVNLFVLIAAGIGLVLSLGVIFLLEFLDDTYKSPADSPKSEKLDLLGSIGWIRGRKHAGKLIAQSEPYSALTESYRIIRSRIRSKSADGPIRSIMVTSAMPGEGKSVTAANLGVVFAQANFRTVVVDGDVRHPVMHHIFSLKNDVGLGDMLSSSDLQLDECLQETSTSNLRVLTSGTSLPDPSARLSSERMTEIIQQLEKVADIVIFDTPPALVFADAVDLSRRVDGVIVMIRAGKSKRPSTNQTISDLRAAKANVLGSIFSHSTQTSALAIRKAYMQDGNPFPLDGLLKKRAVAPVQVQNLAETAAAELAMPVDTGTNGNGKKSRFGFGHSMKSSDTNHVKDVLDVPSTAESDTDESPTS